MIRIGLFGTGHLGRIHARLIKSLNDKFEFVGFFDPHDENATIAINEFGLKRFTNALDLLREVDAIDIVTPTLYHFEVAEEAAKLGKHIFIEKPITHTIEEAEKLIQLTNENNLIGQVGHVERFNPAFVSVKEHLNAPKFIEAHRLAHYNPRGTDVPVVLDLMIHDLDIILKVVDSPIKNISASGVAVVSETPDITNARIEFENGCVANLTASRISLKNMRKTRFFQKDAYISVDFLEKKSEIVSMTTVEGEPDPFDIVLDLGENKPKKKIEILQPASDDSNAILEELKDFHQSIVNQKTPIVSLHDGTEALKAALQIMEKINLSLNLLKENI